MDLIYALAEEIGNPNCFVGRKEELDFHLKWAEGTKELLSMSRALLSRRKKGKTALVQRLFNILYTKNDPKLVPFFFRMPEQPYDTNGFGHIFYRSFLSQYMGFLNRDPELINNPVSLGELEELTRDDPFLARDVRIMKETNMMTPTLVWNHAQSLPHRLAKTKDIRVIQIIDEFQYMNRWIFMDQWPEKQVDLCHSYMGLAESKYAPLLITGSYIGWLTTILNHMTARFKERRLGDLTDEDALATVYNYAAIEKKPVNDETAAYIAAVAYNDPFYISQIFRTDLPGLDLTTNEGVRAALQYETTLGQGFTAKMWMEYVAEGLQRVNDINGKKIVLYLAKHGDEERTRDQIKADLELDISDKDLGDRLYMLEQADLIAPGSSNYRFKGLGDPIFEIVFRKRFAEEIENISTERVVNDFEEDMKKAQRQAAWHKGEAGEYRVKYHLLSAVHKKLNPQSVINNTQPNFRLDTLGSMKKYTFHRDQTHSIIVDIFARCKDDLGMDLIVEIKTWEKPVTNKVVNDFVALKQHLEPQLERPTAFLLYSEMGFSAEQEKLMQEHGVMYT